MTWKEAAKFAFNLFCALVTMQIVLIYVITNATFIDLRYTQGVYVVALLGSLPVFVLVESELASTKEIIIRRVTHFILTAGGVFGGATYFRFTVPSNRILIIIVFAVIYVIGWISKGIQTKKLADKFNQRIEARRAEKAEHTDK